MPFNNDCDLWTVSPASGFLSLSVCNAWSCQTDLPKSQLGSCQCLAKKSYDCPRSTKKDPGSYREFGGLLQAALCLEGGDTSRMIQVGRSFRLNRVLFQPARPPGPELLTHPTLFWPSRMPHSVTTVLHNTVFTAWSTNPLPTYYTDPSQHQDPIPFPLFHKVFPGSSWCSLTLLNLFLKPLIWASTFYCRC